MARQQCLAEEKAERLPKGERAVPRDEQYAYFFPSDAFYRVDRADYERIYQHFKRLTDAEHDEGRHGSGLHIVGPGPRTAAHRQHQLRRPRRTPRAIRIFRFYLSLQDDLMRIFGSTGIRA